MFFAAGIGTVLQTAIGSRLPILEGASFTFVTPAIALLTSSNYECLHPAEDESEEDIWQSRMQILQGGLIIASVVQVQDYSRQFHRLRVKMSEYSRDLLIWMRFFIKCIFFSGILVN